MHDASDLAARLDLPRSAVQEATDHVASGDVTLLAVSGKMASGKDTIAALAMAEMGRSDAVKLEFANALKDQADQVIAVVAADPTPASIGVIADLQGITVEQATASHKIITDALVEHQQLAAAGRIADPALHARSRADGPRLFLQYWGTDVRRAQDPNYWVRQTMRSAVSLIASGASVYITDARFPNEVTWSQEVGFTVARIEISEQTQARRLAERGDASEQLTARTHPSETALDGFSGFDLVVDNNGTLEQSVAAVVAALRGGAGRDHSRRRATVTRSASGPLNPFSSTHSPAQP